MTAVSYVRKTSVQNRTQVARDKKKAKVEAEAVHGAQGWKIHDGTSRWIQPWAPCPHLLMHFAFPVKLVHPHLVLITEQAH